MTHERRWYAGVDWASESHHVLLTDGDGRMIGEKIFKHSGEGLAEMAAWLMATSGVTEPSQIHIAIEVPHGPVVETLIERGFKVHVINPKQMDRFTLAGAKDDSRDAEVMASALRTDPRCQRPKKNDRSGCMGRSRGGLTTKFHALVNADGLLIALKLTEGEAHDGRSAGDKLAALVEGQVKMLDQTAS